jgi:hypothetical protein
VPPITSILDHARIWRVADDRVRARLERLAEVEFRETQVLVPDDRCLKGTRQMPSDFQSRQESPAVLAAPVHQDFRDLPPYEVGDRVEPSHLHGPGHGGLVVHRRGLLVILVSVIRVESMTTAPDGLLKGTAMTPLIAAGPPGG